MQRLFVGGISILLAILATWNGDIQSHAFGNQRLEASAGNSSLPFGELRNTFEFEPEERKVQYSNQSEKPFSYDEENSILLTPSGCNSVAYAQLPGSSTYFLGRQLFDNNGKPIISKESLSLATQAGCAGEPETVNAAKNDHWGLVLARLDWTKKKFTVVKPLLAPSSQIAAGPFKGAVFRAVYDPDVVLYHGQYLIAFECGFGLAGRSYGVRGASACLAVYSPDQQSIDPATITVVVSGTEREAFYSASVPQLLVWEDRLFIYFSVVTRQHNAFVHIAVRGVELTKDQTGFYKPKGAGRLAYSIDPPTIEVWGPDNTSPLSNTSVDGHSVWTRDGKIIMLAALGGSGCAEPRGPQPGCFRTSIASASVPLGFHVFNELRPQAQFPSNAQIYGRPIRDPEGKCLLLGSFYRPTHNGLSELRSAPRDWKNIAGNAVLLAFPFDKGLCP